MVSEIATPTTQARAFTWFSVTGSVSIFLAPLTGGLLARSADHWPGFDLALFRSYPYLLPSFCTGLLGTGACALCLFRLEETKIWTTSDDQFGGGATQVPSFKQVVSSRGVRPVLQITVVAYILGYSYLAGEPEEMRDEWRLPFVLAECGPAQSYQSRGTLRST